MVDRARRAVLTGAAALLGSLSMVRLPSKAVAEAAESLPNMSEADAVAALSEAAEPLPPIDDPEFARFVDRYAEAKVVLLGESTHGTDEFYRARAVMTERLVREHGFTVVAAEADWPDAARVDAYIRGHRDLPSGYKAFRRFPVWMWRNRTVAALIERLREANAAITVPQRKIGFYGLDLYSLPASMEAVTEFVKQHDPDSLEDVRARYECLTPYLERPQAYGAFAKRGQRTPCSEQILSVITEVLDQRVSQLEASDRTIFHALQNARVVAASEAYYRAMYEGSAASWNLRDTHMFETLKAVLDARGPQSKAVVWAHNSHIGDASATDMGRGGEINIGQLCRQEYGEAAVLIGFGTDRGTVTAASEWDGPPERKAVRPALPDSWAALMRQVPYDRFFLDFRKASDGLAQALAARRPERFIGVLYLPQTERISHYAGAELRRQFDCYVWLEVTNSVETIPDPEARQLPDEHPFSM